MKIKCDYSQIAQSYDRYRDLSASQLKLRLDKIIQLGKIAPSTRVLDIGCGTGRLTIPLQQMTHAQVYGLDLSPEMLEQAKQKKGAQNIHWILGDAQILPFPEKFFDCTFMCLVLHHIEDKAKAIREIYRVLKPGGRSLIWTTSHQQIKDYLLNEFFPSLEKIDLDRFPSIATIKTLMKAAGYSSIQEEAVIFQERIATSRYIEKVRNKYISTLSLLCEEEFSAGLKRLERCLPQRYGPKMIRRYQFTIVVGEKA